jgi:hypothetical protein
LEEGDGTREKLNKGTEARKQKTCAFYYNKVTLILLLLEFVHHCNLPFRPFYKEVDESGMA